MVKQRIGIATLHYGYNEGAILQAKALSRLLARKQQVAVEVLDRRYPGKRAIYGPADDARKQALQQAIDHWLPLSPPFHGASDEPAREYANRHYSDLVVGSDVVWTLRYTGRLRRFIPGGILPVQRDPFFPAFPNVYWPDARWRVRRIAYAACTGNLDLATVPRRDRRAMAATLDGFAALSVRDSRSLQLVQGLSSELARRCRLVCDPTLALDLHEGCDPAALQARLAALLQPELPVLLLVMKPGPLSRHIATHFMERGFQILSSGKHANLPVVDLSQLGLSPLEWSLLPRFSRICVTERMHMSIFCLRNNARFVALDMNPVLPGTQTKLEELLDTYGLSSFCRHQDAVDAEAATALAEAALDADWDWNGINHRIRQLASDAADYLDSAMD